MSLPFPFLSLNFPCDEALQWAKRRLSRAGFHVVKTFDLHTTRHADVNCSCPNRSMEDCNCQMIILLLYGKSNAPVTLTLHGNNSQTWLSFVVEPYQHANSKLLDQIRQVLDAPLSAE